MKKKTRRQLKKGMKSLRKGWKRLSPALSASLGGLGLGGVTASGLLVAAALDPRVRESSRELASALGDFASRLSRGQVELGNTLERVN